MVANKKADGPMRTPPFQPKHSATDVSGSPHNHARKETRVVKAESGERRNVRQNVIRQSYSCAECRRLKLKCSRSWPCEMCEKRGCAQICPNGQMRAGKGKRLILADTEELHSRISALEVALSQSHAKNCPTPHPLLAQPYLFSPQGHKDALDSQKKPEEDNDEMVDGAFGVLTIRQEGEARFVGSFAGSEYLREGEEQDEARTSRPVRREQAMPPTPPMTAQGVWDLGRSVHLNPFSSFFGGPPVDLEAIRRDLPDWETEGRLLVESYWENVNWMHQVLPRPMFDQDHLLNAYDGSVAPKAHKLACVFLVMALGAMFDLNREPFDERGGQLFDMGGACLRSVGMEHSSPATVQALHLCGTYVLNDKHGHGAEMFWPVLGTIVKAAQSLGLHRDGTAFGLSPYEIEERRQVWWEIVTYDRLQALCFARPYAVSNKTFDTRFPDGQGGWTADADGFHLAKYRLVKMMEQVIDFQTQIVPMPFAIVTSLDEDLVRFQDSLPDTLMPQTPILDLPFDPIYHPHLVIDRLGIRLLVAQTRLLLNRPFLTRALRENPNDPSFSKTGTTFVALYGSAQVIVQLVKQLVIYHPSLIVRWWFFWFHAFSSAVCLAAIAIHAPNSAFASPAFVGLSNVVDISAATREGCRAKKGLPTLVRLRKRAAAALAEAVRSHRKSQSTDIGHSPPEDDDLSHLVSSTKLRRLASSPRSKRISVGAPTSSSLQIHPSLLVQDNSTPSPRTTGSAATSATLADFLYYDPMMMPVTRHSEQPSFTGAVAPPPPTLPASASAPDHLFIEMESAGYNDNMAQMPWSFDVVSPISGPELGGNTQMMGMDWAASPDMDVGGNDWATLGLPFDWEQWLNSLGSDSPTV